MSKTNEKKIDVEINEENLLKVAEEQGVIDIQFNWKLRRLDDGLVRKSKEILWLEWNDEGKFQDKHDTPAIGRSLIMSPFNHFFTWQTTGIKEIIEETETSVKFKTGNSTYELTKIENETNNQ